MTSPETLRRERAAAEEREAVPKMLRVRSCTEVTRVVSERSAGIELPEISSASSMPNPSGECGGGIEGGGAGGGGGGLGGDGGGGRGGAAN